MFGWEILEQRREGRGQSGFSLIELIVVSAILMIVSGIILTIVFRMSANQSTVSNRTEMHSSVRGATEVLQQEIGQAGRIALPGTAIPPVTLSQAVTTADVTGGTPVNKTVSNVSGMFQGEVLVIGPDSGCDPSTTPACIGNRTNQESVTLTSIGPGASFTAAYSFAHSSGAPVTAQGNFAAGVIPPSSAPLSSCPAGGCTVITECTGAGCTGPTKVTTLAGTDAAPYPGNSSTGYILKLFGDINGDGNMVYVEYWCKTGTEAAPGNLYRNVVLLGAASKGTVAPSQVLLRNVLCNGIDPVTGNCPASPPPCFTYQVKVKGDDTYVVNVAVTLTTQTQNKDPQTSQFQLEGKSLLNVSPRNVFEAWQLASAGVWYRIQPMPASVLTLASQITQ